MAEEILAVKNLQTFFTITRPGINQQKAVVEAVSDVSFTMQKGEILGIVGESGCGKSTLGRSIIHLEQPQKGEVLFEGEDLLKLDNKKIKPFRKKIQMIFQDPYSSLNPRKRIQNLLEQPMRIHDDFTSDERIDKIKFILTEVGLDPNSIRRFPHQFSGGQRQRIGIARALTLDPRFLICDEAVSALDVSVQAQVLNLLLDLQEKRKLTYMFISHDLAVVEFISERILVMYLGKIVEEGSKMEMLHEHLHPYTKALFDAFPTTDARDRNRDRIVLSGDVPSPINPPEGCHFAPRCKHVMDKCKKTYPPFKEVNPGRKVACWLHG